MQKKQGKIITPANRTPWPHEARVARILAAAGHTVEFLPESNLHSPDILLDGVRYEIKSPLTNKADKLERNIKRGLKQSKNIIFDTSRIQNMRDENIKRFLIKKAKEQKQIGRLKMIDRRGTIVDIK